jgi:hypothetical protein
LGVIVSSEMMLPPVKYMVFQSDRANNLTIIASYTLNYISLLETPVRQGNSVSDGIYPMESSSSEALRPQLAVHCLVEFHAIIQP